MRIALLAPDPLHADYAPYAAPFVERYRAVLARGGVEAVPVPWPEAPPPGIDRAIPILAWGYHLDPAGWLRAIDRWAAAVPLVNGAGVLRWNTRKTYLAGLARAGVPVVPTVFAERADVATLAAAARTLGTGDLVVKPQVSGGGHRTVRLRPGESPAEVLPDAMIQPFLPAVGGDGELSLFFFAGRFSHAVRKVAAAGEFRVQAHLGGIYTALEPPADALDVARRALAAAPGPVAYARVEAIEPDLYLDFCPDGGAAWARAIVESLS
jgi:hypothetical protein